VSDVVPAGRFELSALPVAQRPVDVAPTASAQYQILDRTIREVFPEAVVAPVLMARSDHSVLNGVLGDHVFAFTPLQAHAADLKRIHGANGRLSVTGYADAVRFYDRLLSQLTDASFIAGK
jgi:carboxypeptidase PM20D1